jgi:Rieske Fe-S protein
MAVLGLLVAVPAVAYFVAPLRRKRGGEGSDPAFVDAGPLSEFPMGEWSLRALELVRTDGWRETRVRHAIWVRRRGEGSQALTVLSSICPHLGCPVNWHPEQGEFVCPCHRGTFASDGQRIGGPPPRSMDPLEFQVRGGRLWVRWQDFKIGVAERVAVNV